MRVGLRPYREYSVRVEHEPGTSIIHNYGHGGSGVTYSWGCADEVVSLVSSKQLVVPQSRNQRVEAKIT